MKILIKTAWLTCVLVLLSITSTVNAQQSTTLVAKISKEWYDPNDGSNTYNESRGHIQFGADPYDGYSPIYALSLPTSGEVTLVLDTGANIDGYLYLLNSKYEILSEDDNSGEYERSSITQTLDAGTYYVVPTGKRTNSGYVERFDMSIKLYSDDFEANDELLKVVDYDSIKSLIGASQVQYYLDITGSWQDASGQSYTSAGNPRYKVVLTEEAALQISLESETDSYLYLLDENLNILEKDDDDGVGLDARISQTLVPGTYYVVAATSTSFNSSGTDFTLNLLSDDIMSDDISVELEAVTAENLRINFELTLDNDNKDKFGIGAVGILQITPLENSNSICLPLSYIFDIEKKTTSSQNMSSTTEMPVFDACEYYLKLDLFQNTAFRQATDTFPAVLTAEDYLALTDEQKVSFAQFNENNGGNDGHDYVYGSFNVEVNENGEVTRWNRLTQQLGSNLAEFSGGRDYLRLKAGVSTDQGDLDFKVQQDLDKIDDIVLASGDSVKLTYQNTTEERVKGSIFDIKKSGSVYITQKLPLLSSAYSYSAVYLKGGQEYNKTGEFTFTHGNANPTFEDNLVFNLNPNRPPVITSTALTVINEDQLYSYIVTASDADDDAITLSASQLPSWLSFTSYTGALTGTPNNDEVGAYSVVITATDASNSSVSQTFTITVSNVNDAPVISGTPATTVAQGTNYSFTPSAADPDSGTNFTFSIANKPTWASFNTETGNLTGTPGANNVGTSSNVIITVSDGVLTASLTAFAITVSNVNDAPVISGTPATSVAQGVDYSFTPTASDADTDTLAFSIANMPTWATFNTVNGSLTGTPGANDVGTSSNIIITVSDGEVPASLTVFAITVSNVNDAPVFTNTPALTVAQGSQYSFIPNVEDSDTDDTFTFSITSKPAWAEFSVETGSLIGTPGANDVGISSNISITVSDSGTPTLTASLSFSIEVSIKESVDEVAPVLAVPADTTFEAIDASGIPVTNAGVVSLLAQASATDAEDSIGGISTPVTNNLTGTHLPLGETTIVFMATDESGNTVSASTNVIVVDTTAPVLTLLGQASITVEIDDTFVDPGFTALDNVDGDLSTAVVVTGQVDINTVGNYVLSYNVSDAQGNASQSLTRQVKVTDGLPIIQAPVALTVFTNSVDGLSVSDAQVQGFLNSATASDKQDGEITTIGNDAPQTLLAGETTVIFTVTDSAGNVSNAQSTIIVVFDAYYLDPNKFEENLFVLFQDAINPAWPLWDCCAGSTPTVETDDADHGAVAEFSVLGNAETVQGFFGRGNGGLVDASALLTTGQFSFEMKIVSPPADGTPWLLVIEADSNASSVEVNLNTSIEGLDPVIGEWQTYTFDVSAFADNGLDISAIDAIMVFPDWGQGLGAVYRIDNVKFYIPAQTGVRHDLNGDGNADILWRNISSGTNALWTMNGTSIIQSTNINQVANQAWEIVGRGDFDGDGKSDILWRQKDTGENYIYLMDGANISQRGQVNVVSNSDWRVKEVADFDGDGKDDILWRNVVSGNIAMYLMDGFNPVLKDVEKLSNLNWEIVASADVNGDGKADVIWRHKTDGYNAIWLMNGSNITSRYTFNRVANLSWTIVGSGDLNGDGTDDIIWRNQSSGSNVAYLLENGQIKSSQSINTVANLNWQIADISDLNGDGKADLFWRNTSGEIVIYLMDGASISSRGSIGAIPTNWQVIH